MPTTQSLPRPLELTIRKAVPGDALCIGVLGMQVFLDTYAVDGLRDAIAREVLESLAPEVIARSLAQPGLHFHVAESHGHLIGFAELEVGAAHGLAPYARPTELRRLYVQERFSGRGVGSALLRYAEAAAAADGADGLWLTAWVGNQRARAFYPRLGYRDCGATDFTFQGETHENRLFAKALPGSSHPVPA